LNGADLLALTVGDIEAAAAFSQEALAVWDIVGDARGRAVSLFNLARVAENRRQWEPAADLHDRAAALWRDLDQPFNLGRALALRGGVAYAQGDLELASSLMEEAATLFRQLGALRWIGLTDWYRGMFAASQARFLEAARHFRDSLRALIDGADVVWLFKPVTGLAAVAATSGDAETAARWLGAAGELLNRIGAKLMPFDEPLHELAETRCRAALGDRGFADITQAGRNLTLEALLTEADTIVAAVEEAARESRRRGAGILSALTAREREVLTLVAAGKTDREIAETLFVSRRTVNTHVANILGHLGVHSRRDAVDRAHDLGLLPSAADARRYT
jgi:ATP/maltotriose-dependent transcriptional regulator MalT